MNILILAFIFAVGALALLAYAFLIKEPPANTSGRMNMPSSDLGEPISKKLGLQLNTLEQEIGKLSSEHGLLKEQLELAKSIEYGLKDDLNQFRQLKNGLSGDSEKIVHKEIEFEKELAKSADLIQEIKAKIDKIKYPEQDNREMIDRFASLETKLSEYKLAIEAQAKQAQPKGISEEEYNNLKKQLSVQEEVLHKYKQENEAMNKEYDVLKQELRQKEESLNQLNKSQGISAEEYNRLKEKLEQAEEVLKIIHAER